MFKSVLHQISGSIGSTALNLVIVVLTAKVLGAEGRGQITYLLTVSGIIQIVTAVIGSSVMVYMLSKAEDAIVLIASFIWTVVIVLAVSVIFLIFRIPDVNVLVYLVMITTAQSLFNNLLAYYTSKIKFKVISILRMIQPMILIFGLGAYYFFSTITVAKYWQVLIISFTPSFIIICCETFKHLKRNVHFVEIKDVCLKFLKLGGLNQLNNLMQYGSYRFGIWVISNELGIKEVGVFGLWLTVCDAIWVIPTALATVNQAYATKPNYSLNQLNKYLIIAVCISATILCVALCLPLTFYIYVLGNDFLQLKSLIMLSCPILVAFSVLLMYAYYFSAKGLIKYNTLSSGLGFITILSFTSYLTDKLGLKGAILANCFSYSVSILTMLSLFFRHKRQLKFESVSNN